MALTPSTMLPLGTRAPTFALPDVVTGNQVTLDGVSDGAAATVIVFMCNHCPFVKHILDVLLTVISDYTAKGIHFVAISANDADQYPEDSPAKMRELALAKGFTFPYLFDETQSVAKAYHAACTPDFFVFDQQLACVYRGRFDETSPGKLQNPVSGASLKAALDAVLAHQPVDPAQYPSMGCNIKWKG